MPRGGTTLERFNAGFGTRGRWRPLVPRNAKGITPFVRNRIIKKATGVKPMSKVKKIHRRARALANRAGTDDNYKIVLKPKGLLNKVQQKMINSVYSNNGYSVLTCAAGVQAFTWYPCLFTPGDLTTMLTNAFNNEGTVKGQNALQAYFKSGWSELAIQNSTNASARVIIYVLMAKRDMYKDSSGNVADPFNTWVQGIKDANAGGTNTAVNVGSRPTDSVSFNQFWKPKKVIYTELAPGQVHYQRVKYSINRQMNQERASQNSGADQGLKGWTLNYLVITYGEPVGDNAGGATTEACRLNVVHKRDYHYSYIMANAPFVQNANNLGTTTSTNLENLVTGATATFAAVT